MSMEDNSHAGQGPVLLDIGGDIGALIITMPAVLDGEEIEIRPVGYGESMQAPSHFHDAGHEHGPAGQHSHHLPHVAVVGRPVDDRIVHSAVFGELTEGAYELYVRPAGPVQLTAKVAGGQVTEVVWPS
jgi:hypothetical protein